MFGYINVNGKELSESISPIIADFAEIFVISVARKDRLFSIMI